MIDEFKWQERDAANVSGKSGSETFSNRKKMDELGFDLQL